MHVQLNHLVRDQPYLSAFLIVLGSISVGRVIYQTLSVVLQTFILPGTNVWIRCITCQVKRSPYLYIL